MLIAWKRRRDAKRYVRRVAERLDDAYLRTETPALPYRMGTDRLVVVSDHHRGARNRADDFRRCERAYNAALAKYYRDGYTLVVLGDVEELWEERPGKVVEAYAHTLSLERAFHDAGRYLRVFGNHDDAWARPSTVQRHLQPHFGERPLRVRESLSFEVLDDDGRGLGHLFMLHGHQGTRASDDFSWFSRIVVRGVWRNVQRLTGYSFNTPAKDWRLRDRHNVALFSWAERRHRLLLVAGHTHRPVFESWSHADRATAELAEAEEEIRVHGETPARVEKAGDLAAKLEWIRAQERDRPGDEGARIAQKPCYFNTGCCSFLDGDITALEFAGGAIRLVRWPDDKGEPRAHKLAEASLADVLARLDSSRDEAPGRVPA